MVVVDEILKAEKIAILQIWYLGQSFKRIL